MGLSLPACPGTVPIRGVPCPCQNGPACSGGADVQGRGRPSRTGARLRAAAALHREPQRHHCAATAPPLKTTCRPQAVLVRVGGPAGLVGRKRAGPPIRWSAGPGWRGL